MPVTRPFAAKHAAGPQGPAALARGLAAHSSLAPLAVNAVEYAARLATHIYDMGRRIAEHGETAERDTTRLKRHRGSMIEKFGRRGL